MKRCTRLVMALTGAGVAFASTAKAQRSPLLPEKDVTALANEFERRDGKEEFGRDCAVSPAARVAGISCRGGVGGGAFANLRIERRGDPAISGGWKDLLWNAEVTASLGRGSGGIGTVLV